MVQMTRETKYKARLQRSGAQLDELRQLVLHFDSEKPINKWVDEVIRENLLGKPSRSWTKEIISSVFMPRLVQGYYPNAWQPLRILEKKAVSLPILKPVYYYYTAKNDLFLYDFVTTELYNRYSLGNLDIGPSDVFRFIQNATPSRFNSEWSDQVQQRLSRGVMATLRDFGVLEGKSKKRIASFYLPVEAFVFVAFLVESRITSGELILNLDDWKLFLLNPKNVERMFLEAHQHGLLDYNAAGNIIRIEFRQKTIEDLAHDIASRTR